MTLLFAFPGNEHLAGHIACEKGKASFHRYPDMETVIRIESDVSGRDVVILCSLDRPDEKAMTLMFFARTAKELGANSVQLIVPYLGYMRQDKRFHEGEAITSHIFADFLSGLFDGLVTIDPHLHRHKTMSEFYKTFAVAIHAQKQIAEWIKDNIQKPVIIGPDAESGQWVIDLAHSNGWPFIVLQKMRYGDDKVDVSVPDMNIYQDHTPVLVDDIISTGKTMIETIKHIRKSRILAPVCIGIHAIFAEQAYEDLKNAGAAHRMRLSTG